MKDTGAGIRAPRARDDRRPAPAGAGLYIHIPFCVSKCPYCDFCSTTALDRIPGFLAALELEMGRHGGEWGSFDTLYLGGGTPSVLSKEDLGRIVAMARDHFNIVPEAEITVEINPGDLGAVDLERLRRLGVSRLSIGVQSLDEGVLSFLGRRHTGAQAEAAVSAAREAGFENVGIDLIYGVPGQGLAGWMRTLGRALALEPEHLSCYELTLEPKTPLGRRHARKAFRLPSEELQRAFFLRTSEFLEGAGYIHYEVSNFARDPSLASRHNQKYWDHTPYLGLGPSAHSCGGPRRWWNHPSLDEYVAALRHGRSPVAGAEFLTAEQRRLEAVYLGLRTRKGVDLEAFARRHGCDLLAERRAALGLLRARGLVRIEDGHLRPTRAGLAVADQLALL